MIAGPQLIRNYRKSNASFMGRHWQHKMKKESRKPGYIYHYTRDSQISSFQVDSTLVDSTLQENVELVERAELTVKLNIFIHY